MSKKTSSSVLFFLGRKLFFYLVTLIVALTVVWLIPRLMPGDPIYQLVVSILIGSGQGGEASPTSGTIQFTASQAKLLYEYYVKKFGLDAPLYVQYLLLFKRMFTADFGTSIMFQPAKVLDLVLHALPWSLALLVPAIVIGWILGNLLGAYASYKGGKTDNIFYSLSLIINRMPYYWFAIVLIYVFAVKLEFFPPAGAYSIDVTPSLSLNFLIDSLRHWFLPFLSLLLGTIGGQAIGMRSMAVYELGSDYMKYSETLGFSEHKLIRYAFRNAILPQITGLSTALAGTVSGQLVTETVFGYPGVGYIMFRGILHADYPLIEGSFMILISCVLVMNFIMDILYAYIDPRIKAVYTGER